MHTAWLGSMVAMMRPDCGGIVAAAHERNGNERRTIMNERRTNDHEIVMVHCEMSYHSLRQLGITTNIAPCVPSVPTSRIPLGTTFRAGCATGSNSWGNTR